MGAVLVPLVAILILAAVAVAAVVALSRRQRVREERVLESDLQTLRYHTPEGQDPAAVLIALEAGGFEAVSDPATKGNDVLIACPGGRERDRSRIRAVISEAALNLEGDPTAVDAPVRFADE